MYTHTNVHVCVCVVWGHAAPQIAKICLFFAVYFRDDTLFSQCTTGEENVKVVQIIIILICTI